LALQVAWILAAQTAGAAIGSVLSPTKVSVGAISARPAYGSDREGSRPTGTLRGREAGGPDGEEEGRIIRGLLRYAAPLLLGLAALTALAIAAGLG
jgi:hypothetical protein